MIPHVPYDKSMKALATVWRITIRSGDFLAHADFPLSMGGIASDRFDGLVTDEDVENLLREFGHYEDYRRWQSRT
jgi:hypothetical protein